VSRTLFRSLFSFDPRPAPEVDADIRAELDSHLAMIEEELLAQGATPADARAQALARFGDPDRLARQARTIKLGDRIMLQRINLALLIVLGSAVIFLLVQNQRINSRSVQTLEQVAANLAAMQQRQPAVSVSSEPPAKVVYIQGEVQRPGAYALPPGGMNLQRLVAAAGGLKPNARTIYVDHDRSAEQDKVFSTTTPLIWAAEPLETNDVVNVTTEDDRRAPAQIHVEVRGYVANVGKRWTLEGATVESVLRHASPPQEAARVVVERTDPAATPIEMTIAEDGRQRTRNSASHRRRDQCACRRRFPAARALVQLPAPRAHR
jgi:hypothetical protein